MKKMFVVLMMLSCFMFASCTTRTEYGECIGAFDTPNPNLQYSTSGWNVAMGVIGFEMLVPPIVVIASCTKCPVGYINPPVKERP